MTPWGIIPLDATGFNRCKSAIKFIDYSLAGVPSVCSRVEPYLGYVVPGVTGILCANDTDSWVQAIAALIDNPEQRQRLAKAARDHCKKFSGSEMQAEAWQSVFKNLRSVEPRVQEVQRPAYRNLFNPKNLLYIQRYLQAHGLAGVVRRIRQRLGRRAG